MARRTGKTQIERTKTGIITTAETTGHSKGRKFARWEQIGFTSIAKDSNGKEYVDGLIGDALLKSQEV